MDHTAHAPDPTALSLGSDADGIYSKSQGVHSDEIDADSWTRFSASI